MTTSVTVDAHAGWPVQVVAEDKFQDGGRVHTILAVVPAGEIGVFHVWQGRTLIITEMVKPVQPEPQREPVEDDGA